MGIVRECLCAHSQVHVYVTLHCTTVLTVCMLVELGEIDLGLTVLNVCRPRFALSMVDHSRPLTWPCRPGDLPSGSRPESNAASEHMCNTDAEKAPEVQGSVSAIYLALAQEMWVRQSEEGHGVILFLVWSLCAFQSNVCVGLFAGGAPPGRDRLGRGERKCRPGTEAKASSGAQGEEGKHRPSLCSYCVLGDDFSYIGNIFRSSSGVCQIVPLFAWSWPLTEIGITLTGE